MLEKNKLTSSSTQNPNILLLIGIVLIAANLRPAITSVGPLIGEIRVDLNLSNGQAGIITTLPLIGFAVLSILAPRLGRQFGNAVMLFAGVLILAIGILLRSIPTVSMLFIGTAILGLAIAVCNVLLPALIKTKFPNKVGMMTGFYSTAMGVFAALASGISVPLTKNFNLNWTESLALWAIMAGIAAIIWFPQIRLNGKTNKALANTIKTGSLWQSPLAWQVTLFMGFTSMAFYITIAWLPEILIDRGLDVVTAGWMLSLAQLAGLPASLTMPALADRFSDQRLFIVLIGIFYMVGLGGLLFDASSLVVLWVICIGLSQGGSFSLALTFLGLRAKNSQQVSELSGMAQSVGYALAAIGPILFGYLRDITHSWTIPLIMLTASVICLIITGLGAGRNLYVKADPEGSNT